MMKIIKFSLGLLIPLLFIGCAAGGMQQPAPSDSGSVPKWYLNPPQSNSQFYYAAATGSTKDEAKLNALSQISAEISVSIESDFEKTVVSTNKEYSKTMKQNTKASVEKMKFTGLKVIENQYVDKEFYTYLKVDRSVLFNAQKKIFDQDYNKIVSLWKHANENGVFEIIKNQSKITNLTAKVMPKLPILKAINPSFDQNKYTNTLETIANETRSIKSKAMVYVKSKNAKNYAEVLKKHISSSGLTLIENSNRVSNKKNLLIVEVSKDAKKKIVKSSNPRLKGAKFADVRVTLSTKNHAGKVIAKNIVKVLNISKESYKHAFLKTAKFEKEINKRGILNTLLEKN